MRGSKISRASENNSFIIACFMHLKLREQKYMEVGESKVGIGLQGS